MEVITKDRLEFPLQVTIKFDGDSDGVLQGIAELCKLFPRYGDLQGFKKQETAERQGNELVHASCRTYLGPSPNGGSLEMCARRAVAVLREHIEPQLQTGKNLLVTAHANSLMSIITYLDKPTAEEVIDLGMLTGILMLYVYEDGKYVRQGSLVGPTETGVYAYTKMLALSTGRSWMRCQIDGQ